MRSAVTLLVGLLLLAAAGCSADEAKQGTAAPTDTATAAPDTSESADPAEDEHPAFTETDYRYVLVRSCYCPYRVPVAVTVRDGEVASAVALESGGRGVSKGDRAPDSHRLTINDIIDLAEDPSQNATVDWPDDQAWPDRVRTDQIPSARDDEITYVIEQVRVR